MSFTLDKRILGTLIAVVGLIASGAVIAECPDPVGRWAGTFQQYTAHGETQDVVLALRLRADGTMKFSGFRFNYDGEEREKEWEGGDGLWTIDMMLGSCILELWFIGLHEHPFPYAVGPFVDRRTVKAVRSGLVASPGGQGTLHKVSFLR